jgi:hypothetical protein
LIRAPRADEENPTLLVVDRYFQPGLPRLAGLPLPYASALQMRVYCGARCAAHTEEGEVRRMVCVLMDCLESGVEKLSPRGGTVPGNQRVSRTRGRNGPKTGVSSLLHSRGTVRYLTNWRRASGFRASIQAP